MPKIKKAKEENSSLNLMDLFSAIDKALNPEGWYGNTYYSIFEIYPEDHKVMCRNLYSESTDEIFVFVYSVNENDEVSVSEPTVRKMSELLSELTNVSISVNLDDTAKLISEKESKITEINKELSEVKESLANTEKELAEAGKAITSLTEEKENLTSQVTELEPYKVKVDEMEKAELDRQLAEKKNELKKITLEDNLIEESELESNEKLVNIFSELTLDNFESSQEKIDVIKGRRALQKFKENKEISTSEVETSEVKNQGKKEIKTDLTTGEDNGMLSAVDIVKSILKK
jgi:septal ring factor EnvC (AmiA/AmiB activator)